MKYRPEIDGLRAIAVIAVVLYHARVPSFGGGFVGVDVFFVISGFLITMVLIGQRRTRANSLAYFYERRARRILPALYTVLAAAIGLAWLWLTPIEMIAFGKDLIAVTFFVANFSFWQSSGYFDTAASLKPLLHTWSLAIEEQFYLVLPALLALTWRFGTLWTAGLLALIAAASLVLADRIAVQMPAANFFLLPTRAWELLIGCLVAFYLDARRDRLPQRTIARIGYEIAAALGLAMILYSILLFSDRTPFPSFYATLPTVGTALILLCAIPPTFIHRLLSTRVMVGVGLASYSIYLWHHVLFSFARLKILGEPSATGYIALIFLTAVLSYLSWRYIEQPFRSPQRVSSKRVVQVGLLGAVLFAGFGYASSATSGFAVARTTAAQRAVLATVTTSGVENPCNAAEGPNVAGQKPGSPIPLNVTWASIGDSHIFSLSNVLSKALQARGEALAEWACNGCRPSFGAAPRANPCWQWTQEAAEQIASNRQLRNVLVTYGLKAWVQEDADQVNEIWRSYTKLVETFLAAGKKVFVVIEPPQLRGRVETLIFKERYFPANIIGVSRREQDRYLDPHRRRFEKMPKDVVIVDPEPLLCDEDECFAVKNGVAYYYDANHLSDRGAALVVDKILAEH